MSPEDNTNDWVEYKRLVLDWHEQDIIEKIEIKNKLEAQEKSVNDKLDALTTTVQGIGLTLERRKGIGLAVNYVLAILIPLVISVSSCYVQKQYSTPAPPQAVSTQK